MPEVLLNLLAKFILFLNIRKVNKPPNAHV